MLLRLFNDESELIDSQRDRQLAAEARAGAEKGDVKEELDVKDEADISEEVEEGGVPLNGGASEAAVAVGEESKPLVESEMANATS